MGPSAKWLEFDICTFQTYSSDWNGFIGTLNISGEIEPQVILVGIRLLTPQGIIRATLIFESYSVGSDPPDHVGYMGTGE